MDIIHPIATAGPALGSSYMRYSMLGELVLHPQALPFPSQ